MDVSKNGNPSSATDTQLPQPVFCTASVSGLRRRHVFLANGRSRHLFVAPRSGVGSCLVDLRCRVHGSGLLDITRDDRTLPPTGMIASYPAIYQFSRLSATRAPLFHDAPRSGEGSCLVDVRCRGHGSGE
jgi:hypothetical protein